MYNIDWTRLIIWLLPHPLRSSLMRDWLLLLIAPVITVHLALQAYRRRMYFATRATGQVTKLRFYLNYLFDVMLARIEIHDTDQGDFLYIYQEYENKPIYLPAFLTGSAYQFLVVVPAELMYLEAQIRAIIDSYKLPTRKYYILWQ